MNKLRTKNSELRTQQAFTLIELVVAIAILAMVMAFVGIIFKFGIGSYRAAVANAQIMRRLRAVTNQLNSDFKGLRRDAPLLIWFEQYPDANDPTGFRRYDQIMFFSAGDFQSTQLYNKAGEPNNYDGYYPVRGNLARIHYAQAQLFDPIIAAPRDPCDIPDTDRILARRRHILTADEQLVLWPDYPQMAQSFNYVDNEHYEHDHLSLSQWKTLPAHLYRSIVIRDCFEHRPEINMHELNPTTFHKLMCEGVCSFAIQWAYWDPTTTPPDPDPETTPWRPPAPLRWYPRNDPDPDQDDDPFNYHSDSSEHFYLLTEPADPNIFLRSPPADPFNWFGVLFNVPDLTAFWYYYNSVPWVPWYPAQSLAYRYNTQIPVRFPQRFYPAALKFTFTLYDERGILKNGWKFTHIVYLSD